MTALQISCDDYMENNRMQGIYALFKQRFEIFFLAITVWRL